MGAGCVKIMYFDKDLVDKIKERSDGHLLEVIEDFVSLTKDRSGGGYHGTCPCCGHASKFTVNPAKGVFKCWSCQDLGGNSPLSFLMKGKGMDCCSNEEGHVLLSDAEGEWSDENRYRGYSFCS